jgi:hypothetical protein
VRKKYNHPVYPDATFARQFIAAMSECDPQRMLERLRRLVKHVHDRWGGFEIDGFRLRTPVEKGAKPRSG